MYCHLEDAAPQCKTDVAKEMPGERAFFFLVPGKQRPKLLGVRN